MRDFLAEIEWEDTIVGIVVVVVLFIWLVYGLQAGTDFGGMMREVLSDYHR